MKIHAAEWNTKNLGRLWLAYKELQADFTCYNSYALLVIFMKETCSIGHE